MWKVNRWFNTAVKLGQVDLSMVEELKKKNQNSNSGKKKSEDNVRKNKLDSSTIQNLYETDPLVYNAANTIATFTSRKPTIVSKNDKWKKDIENFWDRSNMSQKVEMTIRLASLHGWCAWEFVYEQDKLINVEVISPVNFDYMKDPGGNIDFDPFTGKPKGFSQKLGLRTINFPAKPQDPDFDPNDQKTKDDLILLFLYNSIDNLYGVGFVDASYDLIQWRRKVLSGLSKNIHRHGYPQNVIKYGDEKHQNVQTMINSGQTEFEDINASNEFHIPYWQDIKQLVPPGYRGIVDGYTVFLDEFAASTGVPKSILLGKGMGAAFTDSDKVATQDFLMRIESIRDNTLIEQIQDSLFPKILEITDEDMKEGKPEGFPKLEFEDLTPDNQELIIKEREIDMVHKIKSRDEIRKERGIEGSAPDVNDFAPQFFSEKPKLQDDSKHEIDPKLIEQQEKYTNNLTKELNKSIKNIQEEIKKTQNLDTDPNKLKGTDKIIKSEMSKFEKIGISLSTDNVDETYALTLAIISSDFPELSINLEKTPIDMEAISFFKAEGIDRLKGLSASTVNGIENQISLGLINGESEQQIANRITSVANVNNARASTIARTETKRAYDDISLKKFEEAGVEMVEWSTAGDERVRPGHAALDGKRFPSDSTAVPRDILAEPNCRCILVPIIQGESP